MALLKKNIWLAFRLIVIAWSAVFLIAAFVTYHNVYKEVETQQKSLTKLNANTLVSLFEKYEIVLDVLTLKLIQNQKLITKSEAQSLMDAVLNTDKTLLSLGIFNVDGNIYAATSNVEGNPDYNLREIEHTKATFLETLKQNKAVIGRTYFSALLKGFVIPVRKAVKNNRGENIFVISAAINMEKALHFLTQGEQENELLDAFIFREFDNYFQLAPFGRSALKEAYLTPIPSNIVKREQQKLSQKIKLPVEVIKQKEMVVIDELPLKQGAALSASVYSSRYHFWLTTASSLESIRKVFIKDAVLLLSAFIISLILIYMLFNTIAESEKKKALALKHQATHDYLTQLNNRFHLDAKSEYIDDTKRPYSLLFIDLDNFKTINDRFGHDAGDNLLQAVASRLIQLTLTDEILIRYSGDEFVLITFTNDNQAITQKCRAILKELNRPFPWKNTHFDLSASVGVSSFPADGNDLDEIKRNADLAMYEAKKNRNSFVIYQDELKAAFLRKSEIEQELKLAIKNQELYMVYQPQLTTDGKLHGVEALVRWQNKKLGFVGPNEFIPIAESSGLMPAIGQFILTKSIADITSIQAMLGEKSSFMLSINVSVTQFSAPSFLDDVVTTLKSSGFSPNYLTLEITENIFIEDFSYVGDLLTQIKSYGIKLSLDDFGTGYSSLSYLRDLPIDELKIDKSFVDKLLQSDSARLMIKGILGISQGLNIETVSEGVETQEQLLTLKQLGCKIVQGYVHAKPLNCDDLIAYLTQIKAH